MNVNPNEAAKIGTQLDADASTDTLEEFQLETVGSSDSHEIAEAGCLACS